MSDLGAICCPSPSQCVIPPVGQAGKARNLLKWAVFTELLCCVLRMILFGAMQGLFNLVSVWILYLAFATMHFC